MFLNASNRNIREDEELRRVYTKISNLKMNISRSNLTHTTPVKKKVSPGMLHGGGGLIGCRRDILLNSEKKHLLSAAPVNFVGNMLKKIEGATLREKAKLTRERSYK